jgi:hypothetical protein
MTATHTPIHALVSNVIGGSLMVQHANALDIDLECLGNPESPESFELYRKLTDHLGLNFEVASTHVLQSLTALLVDDEIKDYNVKYLASALWKILGDPAKNGSEPPPIYTEAAKAMYAWTLTLLHPTFIPR